MTKPVNGKPSPHADIPAIDRAGAETLDTIKTPDTGLDLPMPGADNMPVDRFAFVPTTGTKIKHIVEAIILSNFALLGIPAPKPGSAAHLVLAGPYYDALSEDAKEFFVKIKEDAAQAQAS